MNVKPTSGEWQPIYQHPERGKEKVARSSKFEMKWNIICQRYWIKEKQTTEISCLLRKMTVNFLLIFSEQILNYDFNSWKYVIWTKKKKIIFRFLEKLNFGNLGKLNVSQKLVTMTSCQNTKKKCDLIKKNL